MRKNFVYIVLALVLIVFVGIIYVLRQSEDQPILQDDDSQNMTFLKNYQINEFVPVYVSEEQMANVYLNDYIQLMLYDREEAYEKLNDSFKKVSFQTFEDYNSYVEDLLRESVDFSLKSSSVQSTKNGKVYTILDNSGNSYTFEVTGVMVYNVRINLN